MPVKRVRLLTVAVFSLLTVMIYGPPAFAACHNTVSGFTETSALKFGSWLVPGGSVTAVVNTAGSTAGSTGTQLYGTPAAGGYTMSFSANGSCSGNMTISITPPANCGSGCSLASFRGKWNGAAEAAFPLTVAYPSSSATQTLLVGATATYNNTVPAALNTNNYSIVFTYGGDVDTVATPQAIIGFDVALTATTARNIDFGTVLGSIVDDYTINTAGTVTHTGSGGVVSGTPVAGQVTIVGSGSQGVTISVTGTASDQGVSVTAERGKYGAGAEQNFPITGAAPGGGAGTTLLVGTTVHVDGSQNNGTIANPTITIGVVYQ